MCYIDAQNSPFGSVCISDVLNMKFMYHSDTVQQYAVSVGHIYSIHSTYIRTVIHCVSIDQSMYVCMYVCIDILEMCTMQGAMLCHSHYYACTYKTLLWCGGALHKLYTTCVYI